MSLLLDEHRQYLDDPARLDAFDKAIAATVRPGDVVVDLGCGTGILGLMACRAGASRVYAIDDSGMIGVARDIARANGVGDRIVHLQGHSRSTSLPELADVIVSDQIGRLGFEAGVVEYSLDARLRLLKPGGRLVPGAVTSWLAPIEHAALYSRIEFWSGPRAGFDVAGVRARASNTGYPEHVEPAHLLAPGRPLVSYDLSIDASGAHEGEAVFDVVRAGTMHGLAGWFVADLAPGVTMTNAPSAPDRIRRRQACLPIDAPVAVAAGDRVTVRLIVRPVEIVVVWHVEVERPGRPPARFQQSTWQGMLMPREDLERTRPPR